MEKNSFNFLHLQGARSVVLNYMYLIYIFWKNIIFKYSHKRAKKNFRNAILKFFSYKKLVNVSDG